MSKINFYYNRADDVKNWTRHHEQHIPTLSKSLQFLLEQNIVTLQKTWNFLGSNIIQALEKTLEKPNTTTKYTSALTTYHSCPYDPAHNWFMVSIKASLPSQITNIAHELLHLQFIHHYGDYCHKMKINEKQFHILKESLTVILNTSRFQKIIPALDKGYSEHQKIRQKVFGAYKPTMKFQKFLDHTIKIIKTN
ncbi:TPA: hypothetical protein DF272_04760 [Candidatus Falkowbacteria bacterium]|nr:hypothetical protein [Candidatus Falkowbacteria bacterium]